MLELVKCPLFMLAQKRNCRNLHSLQMVSIEVQIILQAVSLKNTACSEMVSQLISMQLWSSQEQPIMAHA